MRRLPLYPSRALMVSVAVVASVLLAAPQLVAQENGLELTQGEWLKINLLRYTGKQVTVRMVSGGELSGVVTKVGSQAVHLSELAGRDFYDAVVRLNDVSAVIVRMRNK